MYSSLKMSPVVVLALVLAGCASPTDQLCERFEECGTLSVSLDQCQANMDAYMQKLSDHARDACESELDACQQKPSCATYLACPTPSCGW